MCIQGQLFRLPIQTLHQVQEIMDMREVKGRTEYKVRWKGWSAKYDSWLPEEELNCPDLLNRFHATHLKNVEEEEEEYEVSIHSRQVRTDNKEVSSSFPLDEKVP